MIEKILHNSETIAIIIYKAYAQDGIKFLSPSDYTLQLGYMKRPKGYQVLPHMHNPVERKTTGTQEVLFIKEGKIRIDFFSLKKVFLESRTLSQGDIILLASGGHSIEVLEEAVIVEVKNGPYVEKDDKDRFEEKKKR